MTNNKNLAEIERLQRLIAYYDALGAWGMVEKLRKILEGL